MRPYVFVAVPCGFVFGGRRASTRGSSVMGRSRGSGKCADRCSPEGEEGVAEAEGLSLGLPFRMNSGVGWDSALRLSRRPGTSAWLSGAL